MSLKNGVLGNLPDRPAWVREVNRKRDFAGTTESPRPVQQLDGAFLFGHERIVADPKTTTVSRVSRGEFD
jgi:hypothetical protein